MKAYLKCLSCLPYTVQESKILQYHTPNTLHMVVHFQLNSRIEAESVKLNHIHGPRLAWHSLQNQDFTFSWNFEAKHEIWNNLNVRGSPSSLQGHGDDDDDDDEILESHMEDGATNGEFEDNHVSHLRERRNSLEKLLLEQQQKQAQRQVERMSKNLHRKIARYQEIWSHGTQTFGPSGY